ncbi:HDOD domain-containing protein [Desulfonatronovibrio hydrogenovorans]|uniref:HDOD domain-containing protein n=1 Tax=Desulfonatronovibrio hydrogenovorans TaxID=53245 RepID=UPI00048CA5BD|nr:HDOD domain-containing protein [Desulfonatronovibrio hydrogenovorans]
MGFINIDDIKSGMTLASDLLTPHGRLILAKGAVFESDLIRTCKAWGISRADIAGLKQEDMDDARMSMIGPEYIRQSEEFIKPFLSYCNLNHPAVKEIVRIAIESMARRFASGEIFPDSLPDFFKMDHTTSYSSPGGRISPRDLVDDQIDLISLPDIFYKLIEIMESPFSSAVHLAELINKDSSLTARLLKLVNSAFYSFPAKIDSVSRAVAILGTKELTSLAAGISVVKNFKGIPNSIMDMELFWKHSISCGLYSGLISSYTESINEERFFIAGLLHDLGRLVMIKKMPEMCLEALLYSRNKNIPLYLAEQDVIGFDHAKVGGLLCNKWKLPIVLEQMVRFHHEPLKARNQLDAGVVNLANLLAVASRAEDNREGVFPDLEEKVWQGIGIETSDLYPLVQRAERQIQDVVHIFLGRE